jgi:hypothetical protein
MTGDLTEQAGSAGTPTGAEDAGRGHRFDRPPAQQALSLGTPEELAGLISKRFRESKPARNPPHLVETVRKVPVSLRLEPATGLFTPEARKLCAFTAGNRGTRRIRLVANLR